MTRIFLLLALITACPAFAKPKASLRVALFDKPPFAWKEDGKMRGFHYAVAKGVSEKTGRPLEINLVPVRRAIEMLRGGEVDIVIMTDQTSFEEMNTKKAWIIEISTYIFTKKGSPEFATVKDVKGTVARLGGGCSDLGISPDVKWNDLKSYEQTLDVLLLGRADAVCGTDSFLYVARSRGVEDQVKSVPVQKKPVYVHALPTMKAGDWKPIETAVSDLVKDGSMQKWAVENSKF